MRMFVVSVIGLAGVASLFAFCAPLRDRAQVVVFGQGTMTLSRTAPAPSQPEPKGSVAVQGVELPGGST